MVIITRKHLTQAAAKFNDTGNEIGAWALIVSQARWKNLAEVRATFPDADAVDGYVIFNIRRNRYRLVTVIHYSKKLADRATQGHVYIRSFLTHRAYDQRRNWDKEHGR